MKCGVVLALALLASVAGPAAVAYGQEPPQTRTEPARVVELFVQGDSANAAKVWSRVRVLLLAAQIEARLLNESTCSVPAVMACVRVVLMPGQNSVTVEVRDALNVQPITRELPMPNGVLDEVTIEEIGQIANTGVAALLSAAAAPGGDGDSQPAAAGARTETSASTDDRVEPAGVSVPQDKAASVGSVAAANLHSVGAPASTEPSISREVSSERAPRAMRYRHPAGSLLATGYEVSLYGDGLWLSGPAVSFLHRAAARDVAPGFAAQAFCALPSTISGPSASLDLWALALRAQVYLRWLLTSRLSFAPGLGFSLNFLQLTTHLQGVTLKASSPNLQAGLAARGSLAMGFAINSVWHLLLMAAVDVDPSSITLGVVRGNQFQVWNESSHVRPALSLSLGAQL